MGTKTRMKRRPKPRRDREAVKPTLLSLPSPVLAAQAMRANARRLPQTAALLQRAAEERYALECRIWEEGHDARTA